METALPYINMGIIMAMAGIDFQYLHEPDYEPGLAQESRMRMRSSSRLLIPAKDLEKPRQATGSRPQYQRKFYQKHKSIYYDTDNIHEQQMETLRLCPTALAI